MQKQQKQDLIMTQMCTKNTFSIFFNYFFKLLMIPLQLMS